MSIAWGCSSVTSEPQAWTCTIWPQKVVVISISDSLPCSSLCVETNLQRQKIVGLCILPPPEHSISGLVLWSCGLRRHGIGSFLPQKLASGTGASSMIPLSRAAWCTWWSDLVHWVRSHFFCLFRSCTAKIYCNYLLIAWRNRQTLDPCLSSSSCIKGLTWFQFHVQIWHVMVITFLALLEKQKGVLLTLLQAWTISDSGSCPLPRTSCTKHRKQRWVNLHNYIYGRKGGEWKLMGDQKYHAEITLKQAFLD
jgi:hypothetical protein